MPVLPGAFAEPEDIGPLEKELPLLREEEAVGRQVELLLVGLDLGEIGIDRQVGGHVRRQPVLQIDARIGRSPERGRGLLLVAAPDDIGRDLELLPLREARQPGQVAEIRDLQPAHVAVAPEDGGPEALLPFPGDGPSEVDPPGLVLQIAEAQGAEGDGDLGRPSLPCPLGADLPDPVPLAVDIGPFITDELVPLGAQGIDRERERVAMVVIGVDEDLEIIVVPELGVPPHLVGHDPVRARVVADDAEIEGPLVVKDADVRGLGRRPAFVRFGLDETVDRLGPSPIGFVQPAVDAHLSPGPLGVHLVQVGRGAPAGRDQEEDSRGEDRSEAACVHLFDHSFLFPGGGVPAGTGIGTSIIRERGMRVKRPR